MIYSRYLSLSIITIFFFSCNSSNSKKESSYNVSVNKEKKTENIPPIVDLLTHAKSFEKKVGNNPMLDSREIKGLIDTYQSIISNYPKDSVSGLYYYKLSLFYASMGEELKSIEVGEQLLQNCYHGLDMNMKKIILENIIACYDMSFKNRDTLKIRNYYEELLTLKILSDDERKSYKLRLNNLDTPIEQLLSKNN